MKKRIQTEVLRYGLMLAMLCIIGVTQHAEAAPLISEVPTGPRDINGNWATPDYYTTANWANSPQLAKFVNTLPGLGSAKANNLGQYLPVAVADTLSYPGSDYYIIELREYSEKMHSDLGPTRLRGYVQVDANGVDISPIHYLGPIIVAERDRPVRIKFTNKLPLGTAGDLFIPVDTSVMGAGTGPANASGTPCDNTILGNLNGCANYTQNRAAIHLHGGRTPWISDGTPHQWITPAGENTPFLKGVSLQNVPDMPNPGDGSTTYYFTNQQSSRLMFYHDHAFGITRLNVYAGEAAGYVITDKHEQDLVTRGLIPADQIPLIIQDKTFVDATPVTHPATGQPTTQVRISDPLWNWGTGAVDANGIRTPVTGDLWMPHVYMPAQISVAGAGGVNPFGRWMYGPWFYPATVVDVGPKPNPYYDLDCSSPNPFILANCQTPGQPEMIPGTPNVSMGMEAFQDSVLVNGTAFPSLTVDPRAYRFRILNAASDRFQNLSFYKADPTQISPDTRPASRLTEIKTVAASAQLALQNNWPPLWPVDGRDGGVPDPGTCTTVLGKLTCSNFGPSFLQIGTEGGFLPKPVEIVPQPITYVTDPTAFWVGNVDKMGLALGPAERADVIVDFSQYAGQTLLLYNDAPAAWPARAAVYDYYTGAPDLRDAGGFGTGGTFDPATGSWVGGTGPLVGYAPNTRTVMQVIVRAAVGTDPAYTFNRTNLEAEFTSAAPSGKTLFERAQEPIIVGQAAYKDAYPNSYFPTNFPWEGINQMNDQFLQFVTLSGESVKAPTEPKGMHDEMGASFDPVYGRMSGNLAMQIPNPTTLTANLILYGFSDLPTETVQNSIQTNVTVIPGTTTLADGTQIWKISHNGVDTHPIHFHIFDVQLINRVGWDGQILLPEPNELGWKDTVKISPLEDTIVAVRPRVPALPFGIPNSLRPLNPAIPLDSKMGFTSIDPATGQAYVAPSPYAAGVTNIIHDFGWEYVWHCHILSHEEMDMMRPIVLKYDAMLPPAFTSSATPTGSDVVLTWNDPTPVSYPTYSTYGDPANEVGFNVYRSTDGITFAKLNTTTLLANSTSYTDVGAAGAVYSYKVEAFNPKGSTFSTGASALTVTVAAAGGPFTAPGPVTLEATVAGLPAGITISQITFYNGATQIGTASITAAPYQFIWNNALAGTHSITVKVTDSLGAVAVSAPIDVVVVGTLTADFTVVGSAAATDIGFCETVSFTSTSTGTITGYSWFINATNPTTQTVGVTLLPGVYPVTLGVVNSATGESAQITKTVTVVNHQPTAITGGPYTIANGGNLTLNASGTDLLDPCNTGLSYAWNLDNIGAYDFFTANPTITYKALKTVLGLGTHTITLKVTDSNGGEGTATTTITVSEIPPTVAISTPVTGSNVTGTPSINITALATPFTGSTITKVEFFADNLLISTDTTAPYSINWTGAALGTHALTVKATDSNGLVMTSPVVTVTVYNPVFTGAITINNGAIYTSTVAVTVAQSATSSVGTITSMRFSTDGGTTWATPWEAFTATRAISLAAIDGIQGISVQFRDSLGFESPVYTDTIMLDTTPTVGTIQINGGAIYATSTAATLTLSATDANGVTQMRFSTNGGTTWTAWVAYATTRNITLTASGSVSVQYKDTVGNLSAIITDTIILDTTRPTGTILINGGAIYATSTAATLTLSATDANGVTQMRFSTDRGTTWTVWEAFATTKAFTLPVTGSVSVQYSDAAGNLSARLTDTIILDTTAPTGTIQFRRIPTTVAATLTLSATDANRVTQMQFSFDGGITWSAWEVYATRKNVTLAPAGPGLKTVDVRYQDTPGNISINYQTSVTLP